MRRTADAVTVRRVAARAGAWLGFVSYCFATKEELTIAMAIDPSAPMTVGA
jgi:DNA-binding transcriptional regulator YbjK